MNYRHAFHAGNHADVFKHAVLALCLTYLCKKEKAWRFIDTHAGRGSYDLTSPEAARSPEWRDGIERILASPLEANAAALLAPYLAAIEATNPNTQELKAYPGSPAIARALARPQDRLSLVELHPRDFEALRTQFDGDFQVKSIELDGWLALGSFVPPKERRGLVLIDPPFEKPGEFDRLVDGLLKAHKRWPGGTYMLWHAVKDVRAVTAYENALRQRGPDNMLLTELLVRPQTGDTFDGSGLVIVNPPYDLEDQLAVLGPALAARLAQDKGARVRTEWLRPQT